MRLLMIIFAPLYTSSLLAGSIPVYEGDLGKLGYGVDSASGKLSGKCLDGTMQDGPPNLKMSFTTFLSENAEDVLEQERGYGSASVDFWIVGAKAKTEFLIRNSETTNQASILWKIDYRGGTKLLTNLNVNQLGFEALKAPLDAGKTCGDSLITGAVVGARLWLAANLIFESAEKYKFFKTKVSASAMGGLLKKSKTSIEEVREIAKGAYLSVQVMQYGGETFGLDLINVGTPSICPIERVDFCLDRYEAIQHYALNPDGFSASVQAANSGKLKVLSYIVSSYADSGYRKLGVGANSSDQGIGTISEALFLKSRQIQDQLHLAKARLSDTSKSKPELDELQVQINDLERKAQQVRNAADVCQTRSPGDCRSQYQVIANL